MKLKKLMHDFLQDYLNQNKIEFSEWSVNVNNQEGFGDYSSNIALKLAKILKKHLLKSQKILLFIQTHQKMFLL